MLCGPFLFARSPRFPRKESCPCRWPVEHIRSDATAPRLENLTLKFYVVVPGRLSAEPQQEKKDETARSADSVALSRSRRLGVRYRSRSMNSSGGSTGNRRAMSSVSARVQIIHIIDVAEVLLTVLLRICSGSRSHRRARDGFRIDGNPPCVDCTLFSRKTEKPIVTAQRYKVLL